MVIISSLATNLELEGLKCGFQKKEEKTRDQNLNS
jgi:hypothetical protein